MGNVQKIKVRINSPGGNVMSAHAIYTLLKYHPATVTIYVDGMAASAASIVAMAGDEIIMPVNTMMMILGIGLCTPPVGNALFVGCVVGKRKIEQVTKAMFPFYVAM
ncbi:Clp protease ClpP, partial [Acetomicrobium sp. S15 = DSM 107314]|uniref:Clp protease ClpP n=1 Tax=Acetomicrobium sp. S15 = DSM 107314 TaxID=2529858 RepID=UPI0031597AD8